MSSKKQKVAPKHTFLILFYFNEDKKGKRKIRRLGFKEDLKASGCWVNKRRKNNQEEIAAFNSV